MDFKQYDDGKEVRFFNHKTGQTICQWPMRNPDHDKNRLIAKGISNLFKTDISK